MKAGSLVELVEDFTEHDFCLAKFYNLNLPVKGVVYTVREIAKGPYCSQVVIGICLEEIINQIIPGCARETIFDITIFRELQPPMDLTELIEETNVIPKIKELCSF